MRGPVVVVAVIVWLAAACGSEAVSPSGTVDAARPSWIVLSDPDGRLPDDTIVGCPNGPWFPASALYQEAPLLQDSDVPEVLDAIAPFLASGEGRHWPQENWRMLHSDGGTVVVVHLGSPDDRGLSFMTAELEDGTWGSGGAQGAGECPVTVQTPEGLNRVDWELDPTAPTTVESRVLALIATERDCVSGQPMGDRLLEPEVVVTDDAVLIAMAARPPEGGGDCPGNPSQTVSIELDEPLGDREVRNGLAGIGNLEDYLR